MNTKGQFDYTRTVGYYMIVLIFVTIIFLTLYSIVSYKNNSFMKFKDDVTQRTIVLKAVSSRNCFAYYDPELSRSYPGILDIEKFNAATANNCFKFLDNDLAFRLNDKTIGEWKYSATHFRFPVKVFYSRYKIEDGILEIQIE